MLFYAVFSIGVTFILTVYDLTMHAGDHHLKYMSHCNFNSSAILIFEAIHIPSTFQSVLIRNTI